MKQIPYIIVAGPTACGKTQLAIDICKKFDGCLIGCDSRQVYKKMDIGTGKDLDQIKKAAIPYYLIDYIDPREEYNVFRYQQDFLKVYAHCGDSGMLPVVCGGSGLYVEAAAGDVYFPEVPENYELREKLKNKTMDELIAILKKYRKPHNTTDTKEKERIIRAIEIEYFIAQTPSIDKSFPVKFKPLIIIIQPARNLLKENIKKRLEKRLNEGMIDEVKELMNEYTGFDKLNYFGLEYRYVALYLQGKLNYNDMKQKLNSAINQFAKRQITFFKRFQKKHPEAVILDRADIQLALPYLEKYLKTSQTAHER